MQPSGPRLLNKFNELVRDIEDGMWVVVNDDETEIISTGYFAKEVLDEAKRKGIANPAATRIRRRPM